MRFAYIIVLLLIAGHAMADESTPLLYSRETVRIVTAASALENPLPWQSVPPEPRAIAIDAEVRDGATFYNQKGWFNLSAPAEKSGVLLVFGAPVAAPIVPATHYAPIDVLLIDGQGKIQTIFPKLVLYDLTEEIYPAEPVAAFFLLGGGACETLGIKPGDRVEYKAFRKPPTIIVK